MQTRKIKREYPLTREDARLNVLANLFPILVDLYGMPGPKKKLEKIEGKEIVAHIPSLNGSLVFKPYGEHIYVDIGDSENAVARLWFNVPAEDVIPDISDIIRTPHTLRGLLHLLTGYLLRGKLKVKGLGPVLKIFRCLMCGKNPMYAEKGGVKLGD
ncbi:MAG: hypothetical protein ACTSU5_14920 [Promethearchaeota archaeon]